MPDNSDALGKIGLLNLPAQAERLGTLRRFNPTTDPEKNINNRSTLSDATSPEKVRAQREKAATDFEALLLQQMVQSMWKTVPTEGMLSGSNEEGMYRDMLSEQFAQELAQGQSLGLKDAVLGEMMKEEKKGDSGK